MSLSKTLTMPIPTPDLSRFPEYDARVVTRVLLVEDNPADADLVAGYFPPASGSEPPVVVERVERLAAALVWLAAQPCDVVLLDLSLPDAHELEAVEALTAAAHDVPIVVMTGLADDEVALAALHAGAQDYLIKGEDGARVVRRAVRYARERHRLQRDREALLEREQVARAEAERASRARDEVLAIVSHDLRNPLSTIVMSARALIEPSASAAPSAASTVDPARIIARAGEWALRIIRDLVDVSAIEAGRLAIHPERMTVMAIAEMLQSLFEAPARAAGVAFSIVIEDAPRWIEADVDRTVQAVGNLVANALKFTARGGVVRVRIARDADMVAFRVEDTGIGITAEHLPHLFDRFWQARISRRGGAGLGLAIARGIAEGHGGRIAVASVPGQGSTFTLLLPANT